jgi:periplasmic mercuric ion binding protein
MKNLKSVIAALVFASFCVLNASAQEATIKKAAITNKVEIKVSGMTCAGCAGHLNNVLSETAGVKDHEVKYPGDVAIITYDPQKTSPEDLVTAIEEQTNYTAEVKKKDSKK